MTSRGVEAGHDWYEISDAGRLVTDPLVSVLILAYNHGKYLAQAIEGVLSQQVDFPIELLIGEDCSPDNTRDVALEYQRRHPGIIRIITADRNVGALMMLGQLFGASRGGLVAVCEGDDYWTAIDKLRRQVAVFSARPDVSMCFHAAQVFDETLQRAVRVAGAGGAPLDYRLTDVIRGGGGMIPTVSIVVRKDSLPLLDAWFLESPIGDYPIAIWAAHRGVVHFLPEVMAVYRTGATGSWTSSLVNDIEKDWRHTIGAVSMLQAFPEKARRHDTEPAVRQMVRKYLRDFAADHGSVVMRRLPEFARFRDSLTISDRLFLFAFNDPKSSRMRLAWFARSKWWIAKRRLARLTAVPQRRV